MMNFPISLDERNKIITLYGVHGLRIPDLALRFGRGNGTIQRVLDDAGIERKRRRPRRVRA